MKYILDNKKDSIKSISKNDIEGLEIKTNKDNILEAEKIILVDETLKDLYIRQKIDKKMMDIVAKMQFLLQSENDEEGNAALVLDETARLKSIIANKYKEHLTKEEYKALFKKIMITEEEFKTRYSARYIYNEMLAENFDERKNKGR